MKKRLSYKEKLMVKCRHFNGLQHKYCANDVPYMEQHAFKICFGELKGCEHYNPMNEKEAEEKVEESRVTLEKIAKGISPCCDATIDESRAIIDGTHKGHGPRFCSKCHKLVYMV